jgi:hypothetical protein
MRPRDSPRARCWITPVAAVVVSTRGQAVPRPPRRQSRDAPPRRESGLRCRSSHSGRVLTGDLEAACPKWSRPESCSAVPANLNDFRLSAAAGYVPQPRASLEPARRLSADCEPEVVACAERQGRERLGVSAGLGYRVLPVAFADAQERQRGDSRPGLWPAVNFGRPLRPGLPAVIDRVAISPVGPMTRSSDSSRSILRATTMRTQSNLTFAA